MTRTPYSRRRILALITLVLAMVACVALAVLTAVWFLIALPFLAAGTYAAAIGMSPSRFFDAFEDPNSGTGTQLPF